MAAPPLQVTVVYAATASDVRSLEVALPAQSTVADALAVPALAAICPLADRPPLAISLWGRRALPTQVLTAGDRIELCRPLQVDPKHARRARFSKQGTRAAGLFAALKGAASEEAPRASQR